MLNSAIENPFNNMKDPSEPKPGTYFVHEEKRIEIYQILDKLKSLTKETMSDDHNMDIKIATQAIKDLLDNEEHSVLTGLYLINPESVYMLMTLIYMGLRIKNTQLKNNLQLVVDTVLPLKEEHATVVNKRSNN